MRRPISDVFFSCAPCAALVALCSVFLGACTERCNDNVEGYCDGLVAVTCEENQSGPFKTFPATVQVCPTACVESAAFGASCADSPVPVPECDGVTGSGCWNGKQTQCVGGFPTNSMSCPSGLMCAFTPVCGGGSGGQSVCALSDIPEKKCVVNNTVCQGNNLAQCECGFIIQSQSCGDMGCLTTDAGSACGQPLPPACPAQDGTVAICGGGNIGVVCQDGAQQFVTDCTPDVCSVTSNGNIACSVPLDFGVADAF